MKAFSLIECLVCIIVISLLLGLGLPAIKASLDSGKKIKEVNAIKNLVTAYNLYSSDNNGGLMKSYDKSGTAYDINGKEIGGEESHEAHRWPWRLAPYFNYNFYGSALINDSENYIKGQGGLMQTYLVSVLPSFGLSIFLGGNDYEGKQYHSFVASNINQVAKPSQTIAFVSSRSMAIGQRYEGFYYVELPKSRNKYDSKSNPKLTGYVSARYNDSAIVAFLGGNVKVLNYQELVNTNLWYPLSN